MAGSVAVPVGKAGDPLVERLCRLRRQMQVGPTDGDEDVDMGPVITRRAPRPRGRLPRHRQSMKGPTVALDGRRDMSTATAS